jgi:enoyl-CoA hydratase/carnithine racemase
MTEHLPHHPLINPHLQQGVLTLSLGDPSSDACWTLDFVEALNQTFDALATRGEIRVIVLRGAGRDFGLGLDGTDWQACLQRHPMRTQQALGLFDRWRNRDLRRLPQPVIAMVTGRCVGVAMSLVEGCDIALAADDARFELAVDQARWLRSAVSPELGSHPSASRALFFHALTDQILSAAEAQQIGWLTFCYRADRLEQEILQLAHALCEKDALALQFTKETMAHVGSMSWDASVSFTAAKFAEIKARQADGPSSRATAIAGFLAGQSKPGLSG